MLVHEGERIILSINSLIDLSLFHVWFLMVDFNGSLSHLYHQLSFHFALKTLATGNATYAA